MEREEEMLPNATTMAPDMSTIFSNDTEEPIYDPDVRKMNGMNVLGLVVFSVALGIIISRMGEVGKPLYKVFLALSEATMILVSIVIW